MNEKKQPMDSRRGACIFCLLCLMLSLFPGAARMESTDAPALLEPVGVKMDSAQAYIGEISEIKMYDAAVIPYVEEVYFPIDGTVEEVHVIVGQKVSAGDPLITLKHEAKTERMEKLQKEIAALEANGAYTDAIAEIDLKILETELKQLSAQSPADAQAIQLKQIDIEEKMLAIELDQALRARELSQKKEEMARLEEEITQAVLLSPMDGQVMFCASLTRGSYISAYSPLIYLADCSRLSIQAQYISPSVLHSAEKQYVLIGGGRYAVSEIPVEQEEYIARLLSGETVYTNFSLDETDESISAGAYAALCLESESITDALLIPSNALYRDGKGGAYVYVLQAGERIRRSVKTGRITDWLTQITEGLEEGEWVYVKE